MDGWRDELFLSVESNWNGMEWSSVGTLIHTVEPTPHLFFSLSSLSLLSLLSLFFLSFLFSSLPFPFFHLTLQLSLHEVIYWSNRHCKEKSGTDAQNTLNTSLRQQQKTTERTEKKNKNRYIKEVIDIVGSMHVMQQKYAHHFHCDEMMTTNHNQVHIF